MYIKYSGKMVGVVKKRIVKKALDKKATKKETSKAAYAQVQKAKTVLHSHKKRKPGYHNKIAIRVDN
jgi:hypothetical protein